MAVKQASVSLEEVQWALLPSEWPLVLKEDWQNKTDGLNETAEVANEANVTANNALDINEQQDIEIGKNRERVKEVVGNLSRLSSVVAENKTSIEANAEGIAANLQGVEDNAQNLTDHENETSAHGVTGNNVGTEDYAQELIGGVVLLAANLTELTHSFSSLSSAPVDYDQTYMQSVVDAVNSLGTQQGDIITLLNEVISGQKDAKQMQPDP